MKDITGAWMSGEMWPRWKASEARTRGLCKATCQRVSVSLSPSEGLVMRGAKQVWITPALGALMRDDREKAGRGKIQTKVPRIVNTQLRCLFSMEAIQQIFFFSPFVFGVSVVILYLLWLFLSHL